MGIELIYCAGKNRAFEATALAAGFKLGAQVPCTTYHPLYFCDQNWKKPDRAAYMAALAFHKPRMATVLDWEQEDQLSEVLDWAEEVSQYCERVLIIPKVIGGIDRIPRMVNGKSIVLAFSIPTKFGGTPLPMWEFAGWPIHLLGGSPHKQMHYAAHLNAIADVISVDGNMANKLASTRCQYWVNGTAIGQKDRYWPALEPGFEGAAPLEAFRRSCQNIMAAWHSR